MAKIPESRKGTGKKLWPKGVSGNPGGRPRLGEEERESRVAALAAKSKAMPSAVAALVSIVESPESKDQDRIAAAKVLLDGLEAQRIELTGADAGPVTVTALDTRRLTTPQLEALVAALPAETDEA